MENKSPFDKEKALNAILYIAKSLDVANIHRVFKVLYFAEREHLSRFGRVIVGDVYIAMNYGPVPSKIYDIVKSLRSTLQKSPDEKYFKLEDKYRIIPVGEVDLDVFSKSEIDLLDKSIAANKELDFTSRTKKSHDEAWEKAAQNGEMNFIDIAKAGGANSVMIEYIKDASTYTRYSPIQ